MTDHISEPLFFFHSAMHCNPSEMSTSIKVRGGAHLFTFGQYFIYWRMTSNLALTLMMRIDIQYTRVWKISNSFIY